MSAQENDLTNHLMFSAIATMSVEDLRHTVLRLVDQLRHTQAQTTETHARFEGALGVMAELRAQNHRLVDQLNSLQGKQR